MKANLYPSGKLLCRMNPANNRPVLAGISAAALVLMGGCATHQTVGVTCGDALPLTAALRSQIGTVALVSPPEPATVGFDKAHGRIETPAHKTGVMAATILNPSGLTSEPAAQALVGVVGVAVAPFAAGAAFISARQRLAPDQLSGCESKLLLAMKAMAEQQCFRDSLRKVVNEKTRRRLILIEPTEPPVAGYAGAETVLGTQLQELWLERTGKGDKSFALRILASVRLVRTADGSVLFERPVEYRSGTCLFLDWTMSDSIQRVAETGYREMAERVVDQIFVATPEGPLLAGPGNRRSPAPQHNSAMELASQGSVGHPKAQLVSYSGSHAGSIRIHPTTAASHVRVPAPLTIDEAALESAKHLEHTFDGLFNHPNPIISLPSIAVAIPVSLWNQVVAGVFGLTERQAREADAQLSKAVLESHPHDEVAGQVASLLPSHTSQLVILEPTPLPLGDEPECVVPQDPPLGSPLRLPVVQLVAGNLARIHGDTVLEISVIDARLVAKEGMNPPLALCVEAEARLLRARDGEEQYSFPISYRSQQHKFTRWAAHDAKLFRQELRSCYRELGLTIVNQLVAAGLVAPDRGANHTLVKN